MYLLGTARRVVLAGSAAALLTSAAHAAITDTTPRHAFAGAAHASWLAQAGAGETPQSADPYALASPAALSASWQPHEFTHEFNAAATVDTGDAAAAFSYRGSSTCGRGCAAAGSAAEAQAAASSDAPEPGSIALMAAGLLFVGSISRRMRRH